MTYKQIEASREARLWISQVIVPIGMAVVTIASIPEAREKAGKIYGSMKDAVKKRKFKKVKG